MGEVCVNTRALWQGHVRAGVGGAHALQCCIVRVAVLVRTRWGHEAYDLLFWLVRVAFMKRTIRCCGTYALRMQHIRGSYAQTYVLHVAYTCEPCCVHASPPLAVFP